MNLTLDIDDEIVAKVSRIAEARDMTVAEMVAEMVAEYLTAMVDDTVAVRKANAAKLMETLEKLSRDMGPRTWTRDDLYEERLGRYGG